MAASPVDGSGKRQFTVEIRPLVDSIWDKGVPDLPLSR